jgi:hypothetical protein
MPNSVCRFFLNQLVRELEVEHSTTLLPRDFSNESADEFEVASNSGMTMNVKVYIAFGI